MSSFPFFLLVHSLMLLKYVILCLPLALLPSTFPVSDRFSMPFLRITCPKNVIFLFLMVSSNFRFTLGQRLPKAQIAFSSILKRNDDMELNARVLKTNQLLQEKLLFSGLDYIDNDNIRYGNISVDGLHINEGGVKILASNFSKYVRYC